MEDDDFQPAFTIQMNKEMTSRIMGRFIQDERGQATTEYVLLLALVVVPIAFVFNQMRSVLRDLLDTLVTLVVGPGV